VGSKAKHSDEVAVKELRLFLSLYQGVDVASDSALARKLVAARKAVAGYEELERRSTHRAASAA
jgi:hypothetical protein